jgi:adenosylcobinamide-phosphate synthase
MVAVGALILAWLLDAAFGEPRNARHPVAWLGHGLSLLGRPLPAWPAAIAFVAGALLCARRDRRRGAVWRGGCRRCTAERCRCGPRLPLLALLLKPALRMAHAAAGSGRRRSCLRERPARRARAARPPVQPRRERARRPRAVRETAVETLAENLGDSLGGAAVLVRCRRPARRLGLARREHDGRDVGLPRGAGSGPGKLHRPRRRRARLAAGTPDAHCCCGTAASRSRRCAREAARTPSPNGGWPMAAMALRLRRAPSQIRAPTC